MSTARGGKDHKAVESKRTDTPEPDDLPRTALAGAQAALRASGRPGAQGVAAQRRQTRRRIRRENLAGRSPGGYSAAGPDPADPQPVGQVLSSYVTERGWERPLAEARVFAEWPRLVGAEVAAHARPVSLRDGQLNVAAESTVWATQLRLLAGTMLARLVDQLGAQIVTKLVITGPVAPSWKHGGYSVRGARGPRDTYG